jgi:uncharacterized RDD family membrane protein YckC
MTDKPAPARKPHIPTVDDFPPSGPNSLGSVRARALARMTDTLIVLAPLVLGSLAFRRGEGADATVALPAWYAALEVVLAAAYDTVFVAWRGLTPGKAIFGLKVARYVDGAKPTITQSALRALVPNVAAALPVPIAGGLAAGVYLTALLNPLRRGWPDQAGGTIVISTR